MNDNKIRNTTKMLGVRIFTKDEAELLKACLRYQGLYLPPILPSADDNFLAWIDWKDKKVCPEIRLVTNKAEIERDCTSFQQIIVPVSTEDWTQILNWIEKGPSASITVKLDAGYSAVIEKVEGKVVVKVGCREFDSARIMEVASAIQQVGNSQSRYAKMAESH